jgi:hypothetical protein
MNKQNNLSFSENYDKHHRCKSINQKEEGVDQREPRIKSLGRSIRKEERKTLNQSKKKGNDNVKERRKTDDNSD